MRRIYLAARAGRRLEMLGVASELASLGFQVTSSWIHAEQPEETMADALRGALGESCLSDLVRADGLITFTEPSDSTWARGGRHVELGYALGLGDFRVIVVGHRENVFHCLSEVEFYATWDDAKAALGEPGSMSIAPQAPPVEVMPGCWKHATPVPTCADCIDVLRPMYHDGRLMDATLVPALAARVDDEFDEGEVDEGEAD